MAPDEAHQYPEPGGGYEYPEEADEPSGYPGRGGGYYPEEHGGGYPAAGPDTYGGDRYPPGDDEDLAEGGWVPGGQVSHGREADW
jgi:hypothetical protein